MDTYTPIQKQEQKKCFILYIWNSFIDRTVLRCDKFLLSHLSCTLFIDTFKYKKTISKLSYASYPSVIKGYGGGIVFMFYGTMIILLYYNII